jgi:hypothetical protein
MALAIALGDACTGAGVHTDCRGRLNVAAAIIAAEQTVEIKRVADLSFWMERAFVWLNIANHPI